MVPSRFFPGDIVYYFTDQQLGLPVITSSEKELVSGYGTKRLADFCTGRYCLRKCTGPLGFYGDILIGDRGMPLLPAYLTGSLSHSKNLCGAVAASKNQYLSLGIDIETHGRVYKEMWRLLFTKTETAYLERQTEEQQKVISTLFFSLKEAFYKLQYPLTGVFLEFTDVEIHLVGNYYYVKTLKNVNNMFPEGKITPGKILRLGHEVITWCGLPARGYV